MIDHSNHQNFKFIVNNEIVAKFFDDFKLKKTDENFKNKILYNINFNHNNSLKSKKIIDILEKNIKQTENNQFIIKEKR